jgi:hypothetical protein
MPNSDDKGKFVSETEFENNRSMQAALAPKTLEHLENIPKVYTFVKR